LSAHSRYMPHGQVHVQVQSVLHQSSVWILLTRVWLLINRFAMVSTCASAHVSPLRSRLCFLEFGAVVRGGKLPTRRYQRSLWPVSMHWTLNERARKKPRRYPRPATAIASNIPEPRSLAKLDSFSRPVFPVGGDIVKGFWAVEMLSVSRWPIWCVRQNVGVARKSRGFWLTGAWAGW
jgi:hypothetical protein